MKKNLSIIKSILLIPFANLFFSCMDDNSQDIYPNDQYKISLSFQYKVKKEYLLFDTLIYTTSIGNQYMIDDLQYFISNIKVHIAKGKWVDAGSTFKIRYIDAKTDLSKDWQMSLQEDPIKADSISFIFGIDEDNNISYHFSDPPERDMFWPEILGGGYHYMKMNMKWKNSAAEELMPFMFHLGIGQMYTGNNVNTDSIIGYIQNYFTVKLPLKKSLKYENLSSDWMITMYIDKWFDGPSSFNFAKYPMGIMQNQEGMFEACRNGREAFSIEERLNIKK